MITILFASHIWSSNRLGKFDIHVAIPALNSSKSVHSSQPNTEQIADMAWYLGNVCLQWDQTARLTVNDQLKSNYPLVNEVQLQTDHASPRYKY